MSGRSDNGNGIDDDTYLAEHIRASRGSAIGGARIVQINHVSTPQMVAIILAVALSCLSLGLWYSTTQTMQLYEREIRLAQRDAQDAKNGTQTLREVLEIVGLKIPKKENDNEQQ